MVEGSERRRGSRQRFLRGCGVWIGLVLAACAGCDRSPDAAGAPEPAPAEAPQAGTAPLADAAVAAEPAEAEARIEPEPPPAWEALPVDLPLVGRPSAIGGGAGDARAVLLAYRVDVDGESRCPVTGQPSCHVWYATVRGRALDAPEPVATGFAESDTPSGIVVDEALARAHGGFAVVWHDGRYADDLPRLLVSFVGDDGAVGEPVAVLADPALEAESATASALANGDVLICWSGADGRQTGVARLRNQRIWCRAAGPGGASGEPVALAEGPVRSPALSWRGQQGLLTWVRAGMLEGVLLDAGLRPASGILTFGPSLARSARVAAGHGGYLVAWQSAAESGRAAQAVARRLERDGGMGPPLALSGLELEFVRLDPVSAVPSGFVVTGRPDGETRLVVVHPDGRAFTRVAVTAGRGQHLMGVTGALLELGAEAPERVVFRDAFSVSLGAPPR